MKTIPLLAFFLSSCLAFAETTSNDCTKNLFNLHDWSELSNSVLSCLDTSAGFTDGITALCTTDKRQLSVDYQQYLKYKKEYEVTLAWYQSLTQQEQQSATARYKLRLAKENWENLGLKNTIRSIKNRLDESYRNCNP